ncbi:hypothetical protein O181_006688 [Austropuccinia psidii MF-1]|uniref:Uncharacterized protein n=1 Tax=Austropuccinia psidii MF-1 TaxID=1389203 RepID=A0A9Q3GGU1_9BASI|nr:hypothetical protein [Austropuccinia psidii MF-1]
MAKKPKDTRHSNWQYSLKNVIMASGSHKRPPATFISVLLSTSGKTPGPTQWIQACGNQRWCIYGIIYNFAPLFLRNPMVIVSGLNSSIQSQVPKSLTHFKQGSSSSVLHSMPVTRRPFKDPNSLSLLVLVFDLRTFQEGYSKMFAEHQDSCQGIKHFSTRWTIQLVHTGCIQETCMALTLLGQLIFHCEN